MNKREGRYAVQVGTEILFYDSPTDKLLRALKVNAKNFDKTFKLFKITDVKADGWILLSENEPPVYFNDFQKAFEYSHQHTCSVQCCRQVYI